MPRPLPAAVLALSLALPSAAVAIPPPPPVAVVLVHAGGPSEASEQLLDSIGTGGAWFEMTPAPVEAEAFEDCVTAADAEACVRGVLAGVDQDRPPVVVILTRPAPGFYAAWTCIGPGEAATQTERQSVSFDTSRWDNATLRYWHEDRATAAGCVLAAASESGWQAMSTRGHYLAVFTSDKTGPKWAAWRAMSEAEQQAVAERGVAAVKAWDEAHRDVIVHAGGPLGPTKRIGDDGRIEDVINLLTVFMVVRADSHEAAARLFEGHPHMDPFPCDGVEVMPVLGD